jgi:hypothetical protein
MVYKIMGFVCPHLTIGIVEKEEETRGIYGNSETARTV